MSLVFYLARGECPGGGGTPDSIWWGGGATGPKISWGILRVKSRI